MDNENRVKVSVEIDGMENFYSAVNDVQQRSIELERACRKLRQVITTQYSVKKAAPHEDGAGDLTLFD